MEITYINGFISETCLRDLKDFEQVRDAIIVAKCKGFPFRGKGYGHGSKCNKPYSQQVSFYMWIISCYL